MDDDKFSDPRMRSKRGRGRGGRGRGRGGRGASQAATAVAKKKPDLGTNAYRYEREEGAEGDEDDAYEAGVDFEEIADAAAAAKGGGGGGGGGGGVEIADAQQLPDDVLSELVVDFSKLDGVLAAAPLWVRLGEDARFALGVPPGLGWGDVVEGFDEDGDGDGYDGGDGGDGDGAIVANSETGLLGDIAALELEDEDDDDDEGEGAEREGDVQTKSARSVDDGEDDFDKWLDGL